MGNRRFNATGGHEFKVGGLTVGLIDGSGVAGKASPLTKSTAGVVNYTAAELRSGIILRDPAGGNRADTFPTAAAIVANLGLTDTAQLGVAYSITIRNTADAAETITMTTNTGLTLSGNMAIAQNQTKEFLVYPTSLTAVTIYTMASVTAGNDFGSGGIKADVIAESTSAAGVTVDGVLLKDSAVTTDTINEKTAATGVTVDGVLLKDSEVTTDVVNEKTSAAGVTLDGVKLKDSEVYTDVINEKTAATGVTIDGVQLKDSEVTTDTINEKTATAGVSVDGCLIKDGAAAQAKAIASTSVFLSTEQTGNDSEQSIAHGLTTTPAVVIAIPSALTGGAFTVTYGTHDGTNAKVTVSTGEKYKVLAIK